MTTNDPAVCEVIVGGDTTPPVAQKTFSKIIELAVTNALLIVTLELEAVSETPYHPILAPEPFAGDPRPNILCGINDISTK